MGEPTLSSEAFGHGGQIPRRHTCEGEDLSPPLAWSGLPEGTRSAAIICDDPDAPSGTFTHWVAWGLDPGLGGLAEGVAAPARGTEQLRNPRLPRSLPATGPRRHRYFFRLFALGATPEVEPGADRDQLERAIEGHVLGLAELVGTFERPR